MLTIPEFIKRCDDFCAKHEVSRVWLSKRLLANTDRLELLATGKADIGVNRMARAIRDLQALEHERANPDDVAGVAA